MFIKYPPLRPSNPPSPTREKATKGTENKVAANIINKPVPISSTAGPGRGRSLAPATALSLALLVAATNSKCWSRLRAVVDAFW